jgi:DNA-binding transcriptional regulator YiaG
MTLPENFLTKKDIELSNFAKALALPVRICIIRLIIENGNEATRQMLHQIPFNQQTINQHLIELKHLGILKTIKKGKSHYFTIDEDMFITMSNYFLLLFQSISKLNEQANALALQPKSTKKAPKKTTNATVEPFGRYIKTKRKALNISQDDFATHLQMDRTYLSRIESGKISLNISKLKPLALLLNVPYNELEKAYYQDKMNDMDRKRDYYKKLSE